MVPRTIPGTNREGTKGVKITSQTQVDTALSAKHRPASGRAEHPCGEGLELHVSGTGAGRWICRYRPRGKTEDGRRHPQRKALVGTTGTHALKEARAAAAEIALRAAHGHDPLHDDRRAAAEARAAALEAERQRKAAEAARVTCRILLTDYETVLTARGRSPKHRAEELKQTRLGLGSISMLDAPPGDITTAHVERINTACPEGSRAARFGALDRFLRWALRRDPMSRAVSPTALFERHERPRRVPARQRVLDKRELAAVWSAASALAEPGLRDLVQFLICVPCREGEAVLARWRDIDTKRAVWMQPTSKNGLSHAFPLTDRSLAMLESRRVAAKAEGCDGADDLVFPPPQKREGKTFVAWSALKRTLDRRLDPEDRLSVVSQPVTSWRIHDLRRTCATALGERGFSAEVIDLLLNHRAARSRGGIAGVYNRSERWNERVLAMASWDAHLAEALGEAVPGHEPGSNVIPLPSAAGAAA
jgi:integrase